MARRLLAVIILLICGVEIFAQLPQREPVREWKTAEGQAFQAAIESFDGTTIVFRAQNGQRSPLALARLAAEDQAYVTAWQEKQPIKVVMPDVVGVDSADVKAEVVSEDERNESFVYRTQHFEFISQGKFTTGLLREVARNFEATYELLKALPWQIDPRPASGEYFRALLLRTRSAYEEMGGPKNSGGVYMRSRKVFLVPFDSIGLKVVGKSYAADHDYETHTLVHELTHQMMHFWLSYLPQWVVEGTAEYTATLPLKNGRFRVSSAKSGLRDYFDRQKRAGIAMSPYPLDELFSVSGKKWNQILEKEPNVSSRLYFTSFLLVYYFMHMDSDGNGQRFVRYLREVGRTRKEVEDYYLAVEEFKKQPGVEVNADGSYRWRGDLKHPEQPDVLASESARDEFQKKTLAILLDGRGEKELMEQIRSAYVKLGIRL